MTSVISIGVSLFLCIYWWPPSIFSHIERLSLTINNNSQLYEPQMCYFSPVVFLHIHVYFVHLKTVKEIRHTIITSSCFKVFPSTICNNRVLRVYYFNFYYICSVNFTDLWLLKPMLLVAIIYAVSGIITWLLNNERRTYYSNINVQLPPLFQHVQLWHF